MTSPPPRSFVRLQRYAQILTYLSSTAASLSFAQGVSPLEASRSRNSLRLDTSLSFGNSATQQITTGQAGQTVTAVNDAFILKLTDTKSEQWSGSVGGRVSLTPSMGLSTRIASKHIVTLSDDKAIVDAGFSSWSLTLDKSFTDDAGRSLAYAYVSITPIRRSSFSKLTPGKLQSFGQFSAGLAVFKTVDPVVFSLVATGSYSRAEHFSFSKIPASKVISITAAVDFAINDAVSVSANTGLTWIGSRQSLGENERAQLTASAIGLALNYSIDSAHALSVSSVFPSALTRGSSLQVNVSRRF